MALDPETLDLAPVASRLLDGLADERFKLELPASQLEIVTAPHGTIGEAVEELLGARLALAAAVGDRARLAAAGAHPFTAPEGALNSGERNERLVREYGAPVARRQLVCGLHVHVAVPGADRALAVYNALRGHLPELAALGANAPLQEGRDTGFASVRPLISGLLPRQGVPPAFDSWEELAGELAWGAAAGRLPALRGWWWELRLHPALGTIEVRVPDAQSAIADVGALAATVGALVLWLAERHDAGELPEPAPSWRIAENGWSAARAGVHGEISDLVSARRVPTRERLHALLATLGPFAARIGGEAGIERAREMTEGNGADAQRAVAAELGERAVAAMLAERFLEGAG